MKQNYRIKNYCRYLVLPTDFIKRPTRQSIAKINILFYKNNFYSNWLVQKNATNYYTTTLHLNDRMIRRSRVPQTNSGTVGREAAASTDNRNRQLRPDGTPCPGRVARSNVSHGIQIFEGYEIQKKCWQQNTQCKAESISSYHTFINIKALKQLVKQKKKTTRLATSNQWTGRYGLKLHILRLVLVKIVQI